MTTAVDTNALLAVLYDDAHADALVSFDGGFYGTYFPSLAVRPE